MRRGSNERCGGTLSEHVDLIGKFNFVLKYFSNFLRSYRPTLMKFWIKWLVSTFLGTNLPKFWIFSANNYPHREFQIFNEFLTHNMNGVPF